MNIELLRQVQDRILREPERFDMPSFFSPCGTTACIAGWAISFGRRVDPKQLPKRVREDCEKAQARAENVLGLDKFEGQRLFYLAFWPTRFVAAYKAARRDPRAAAKIAWNRIEHFIATEGRE